LSTIWRNEFRVPEMSTRQGEAELENGANANIVVAAA